MVELELVLIISPFEIGYQPCHDFKADDFAENWNEYFGWYSRHNDPRCRESLSFCVNCARDHHAGGWDSCGAPKSGTDR